MASIRVFVKKQIEVGRMNFGQKQMLKLGTVGLADVKRRISRAITSGSGMFWPVS